MKSIFIVLSLFFSLNCFGYYQVEQGRWAKRDPIGESGGIPLYGFINNKTINSFDALGLINVSKCNVVVEINHGERPDWKYDKDHKFPKCSAYGVVGCKIKQDQLNDALVLAGVGIPNMPRNNGESVGPGRPKEGESNNGDYPDGRDGFEQYLNAAWETALKRGESICKSKDACCSKVLVMMQAGPAAPGKIAPSRILGRNGLGEWSNKRKYLRGCSGSR